MRRLKILVPAAAGVVVVGLLVGVGLCSRGEPIAGPGPTPTPGATPSATASPTPVASPTPTGVPAPAPPATAPAPGPTAGAPDPPPAGPIVPAALRGKDVEVIPTSRRVVALTFDGGANNQGLASILATLSAKDVAATFFLTGGFADRYPSSVRAIVGGGHRLANHTDTHPHLPGMTDSAVRAELSRAEARILAAGGTDPRPLFRFPFGDRDAHTIAVVNDAGYLPVRWTVDSLGWKGTKLGGMTVPAVVDRVVGAAVPGEIVLMHVGSNPDDGTTLDAQALPTVIDQLRALGYDFVTLDALL
jgi:peptidoglycan/xylan/chitin deacetylase (PgdA/CDA1 family)